MGDGEGDAAVFFGIPVGAAVPRLTGSQLASRRIAAIQKRMP
jgi:hypothetical protein